MSSTYRYTRLDHSRRQIRLLHLHPPDVSDTEDIHGISAPDKIQCTFSLASLHDEPYYEALSYVWGTSETTASVLLHGHCAPVTQNLETILRHLRRDKERILWIDALCINQSDVDERSHQVSQMHDIYSQAFRVIAYLGEAWDGVDTTFELMTFTGNHPDHHWNSTSTKNITSCGFDVASALHCDSIARFFSSPWWTRIWTVQECVLARRMEYMYGEYRLDAEALHRFQDYITLHGIQCCAALISIGSTRSGTTALMERYLRAIRLKQLTDRTATNIGFLELTAMFRSRLCLNPSDKIYGLLGMAPQDFRARVAVDYNCSTRDVYKSVSIGTLARGLMLLSCFYGDRDPELGLPSWVLDFSTSIHELDNAFYMYRLRPIQYHFRASLDSRTSFKFFEPDKASMRAIIFDMISLTNSTLKTRVPHGVGIEGRNFVDACWQTLNAYGPSKQCYTSISDAFWRTFCGGVIAKEDRSSDPWYRPILGTDFAAFEKWRATIEAEGDRQRSASADDGARWFNSAFRAVSMNRRFAVTDEGYIGWAPVDTRKGDVVALFPGGNVPYVLRPVSQPDSAQSSISSDTWNRRYEFLGDAYIHGIMHGEAWNEADLEEITLV
jgi:hypothetical protein